MMYNKFVFFFLLFCFQSALSQNNAFSTNYANWIISTGANSTDIKSNNIDGTEYIDKNFYSSTFSCISEVTPPIRYNTYKEEMEFVLDGKLYYLNKNKDCELTINNKTYQYFIDYDKKENNGYLIIINKSKNSKYLLYKKEKVKFIPPYIPSSPYAEEKPAKYVVEKSKFFIKIQDSLTVFPEKKSDLLKLFPTSKDAIELFLNENKIKFNEESSLLVLINFLNTL